MADIKAWPIICTFALSACLSVSLSEILHDKTMVNLPYGSIVTFKVTVNQRSWCQIKGI